MGLSKIKIKKYGDISNLKNTVRQSLAQIKVVQDRDTKCNLYKSLGWAYDQWAIKESSISLRRNLQKNTRCYFHKAVINRKTEQEAFRGLGTVAMHAGQYKRAIHFYTRASRLGITPDIFIDFGNVSRKLKCPAEAERFYKKALEVVREEKDIVYKKIIADIVKKNIELLKKESKRPDISQRCNDAVRK